LRSLVTLVAAAAEEKQRRESRIGWAHDQPSEETRVCASDGQTQLSLCEQLQAEGNDGVGVATWFVSHAWMYTCVELLETLEHLFTGEPQGLDTCIWLDMVSTSQHGTFSRPPEWWRQMFILAVQSMGNLVMVMAPWYKPVTLTRAWSILELYACSSSGCRFEVAFPEAQRADMAEGLMWENDVFF